MAEESLMSKKNIVILLLMVAIMSSISYAVLIFYNKQKNKNHEIPEAVNFSTIVMLDPMLISLFTENKLNEPVLAGHLQIQLGLLIDDKNSEKIITNNKYKLINMINDIISSAKTRADVFDNSVLDNEGKMKKLKDLVLLSVNQFLKARLVSKVYFKEYFFQPLLDPA